MAAVAAGAPATVLLALSLCVTASTQTPSQVVPPLRATERIKVSPPISVTLRLSTRRAALGEVPTFTVVIRNGSGMPLLLNPAAVSNIQIFAQSGELVPRASGGIADYVGRALTRSDFIPLGPGRTHEFTVQPEYHALGDYSRFASYLDGPFGFEGRLKLPAGDYSVRLTYVSLPDYTASGYSTDDTANVWEGLIEAPAVSLTVLPPPEDDARDAIAQIDEGEDSTIQPAPDLLRLGRVAQAIDPLLRRFDRTRDMQIAEALLAIDASRAAPRLLALFGAVQGQKEQEMRTTGTFAKTALAAPDCASVPLIVEAMGHGDIVPAFGDPLRDFADRCPDLRTQLITLLRTPVPVPATYQGGSAAYARQRAAEALGRIGNREDVPLLIAVLQRDVPGLPPATNWYGDPAREGAARALGRLGGAQAAAALSGQLNDRTGNRFIMRVIVEELGAYPSHGMGRVRSAVPADALGVESR